jgi:hypothetical protein
MSKERQYNPSSYYEVPDNYGSKQHTSATNLMMGVGIDPKNKILSDDGNLEGYI